MAETRRTEEGLLLNLRNDLLFETDSAVLTEAAIAQVSRIGDILVKYPMVLGRGETEPVAPNETPSGRSANRRVELHIDVPRAS